MICGHVLVKVERIKQSVLITAALSHHAGALPSLALSTKTLKTQHRSRVFQRNRPKAVGHECRVSFHSKDDGHQDRTTGFYERNQDTGFPGSPLSGQMYFL
jgi:hypothetical protein